MSFFPPGLDRFSAPLRAPPGLCFSIRSTKRSPQAPRWTTSRQRWWRRWGEGARAWWSSRAPRSCVGSLPGKNELLCVPVCLRCLRSAGTFSFSLFHASCYSLLGFVAGWVALVVSLIWRAGTGPFWEQLCPRARGGWHTHNNRTEPSATAAVATAATAPLLSFYIRRLPPPLGAASRRGRVEAAVAEATRLREAGEGGAR